MESDSTYEDKPIKVVDNKDRHTRTKLSSFLMFKGVSRPRKKLSTDDFVGVYVKLESCEETIVVLFGMQKPWNYPNAVHGEDNSVVLVRMPDC